ncbi:helix-hairpin-helix domain-containing protein [Undibacterium jejuense]|uniref:Helix-hairpin-helix domain-containing protein n=1 Tax=Undibacterium jejuense TaxID=1344949 RepID=A0A923KQB5_9BURK|nr:helix-hairpin-helix domain-containing protein [Undibacterium jejuense]MBC3862904.1 helix-hairpin-helix domain-containing protein [Undibacterium jejuense]
MFKKLLLAAATMIVTMGFAIADVDVNKADQAALDGVKGIGPAKSKAIIAERSKNGNFKDWADFETRVRGIGDKNSVKMSQAGLTVNGQPKSAASATASNATSVNTTTSTSAKAATKDSKTK